MYFLKAYNFVTNKMIFFIEYDYRIDRWMKCYTFIGEIFSISKNILCGLFSAYNTNILTHLF